MKNIITSLALLLSAGQVFSAEPSAEIDFDWTLSVTPGVDAYRIYEKEGTNYTLRLEVSGTNTIGTVEGIVRDKTRVFVCRAVRGEEESPDSQESIVKPELVPPEDFRNRVSVAITIKDGSIVITDGDRRP